MMLRVNICPELFWILRLLTPPKMFRKKSPYKLRKSRKVDPPPRQNSNESSASSLRLGKNKFLIQCKIFENVEGIWGDFQTNFQYSSTTFFVILPLQQVLCPARRHLYLSKSAVCHRMWRLVVVLSKITYLVIKQTLFIRFG